MPLSDDLIEGKSARQSERRRWRFLLPSVRWSEVILSGGNNSQPASQKGDVDIVAATAAAPPHSSTQTTAAAAEIVTLEKAGGSVTLARPLHHCRCGVIR